MVIKNLFFPLAGRRKKYAAEKFLSFVFCAVFIFNGVAQDEKPDKYIYNGLIKTTGTISPGLLVSSGKTTLSFHGFLEFFPEDKTSWRGDIFYFMGEQKKPSSLYQNSTLKWGPFYHFHKKRLDYYIGLQPGFNFVQPQGQDANGADYYYAFKTIPIISPVTGFSFNFSKYFDAFLEGTYIAGRYMGEGFTKINVSEFRISAGLGFHFETRKDCGCQEEEKKRIRHE